MSASRLLRPLLAALLVSAACPLRAIDLESLVVGRHLDANGKEIVAVRTLPIPERPSGLANGVVNLPSTAVGINGVPAFDWTYGCSSTAAGMLFGYYDRFGYDDFYIGPVDDGVCPLTNSIWGHSKYGSTTCGNCPLVATKYGLDGRNTYGHVNDYWYALDSTVDPFYDDGSGWTPHASDSVADFMGTNQYQFWNNVDGATTFYYYDDGTPLYDCPDQVKPYGRDGAHGMRLFAEYCGYTTPDTGVFNQLIDAYQAGGFTFEQYMDEIDAGRPVLIQVSGHTMLGIGYDPRPGTVYVHDSWDYQLHEMTWGGYYEGMRHYMVTALQLDPAPPVLRVSATELDARASQGSYPANQTFNVWTSVGGFPFYVKSNVPWMSLTPVGGTASGTKSTITVVYDTASLAEGDYSGAITVEGNGQTVVINVYLTIAARYVAAVGSVFTIPSPIKLNKKPTVFAADGYKKYNAKVQSWTSDSVIFTWTAKAPAKTYRLMLKQGNGDAQWITDDFVVSLPVVTGGNWVPPALYVDGDYLGTTRPTVWLEYYYPSTGKFGKLNCKVISNGMNYVDSVHNMKQYDKLLQRGAVFTAVAVKSKIGTGYYKF